MNEMLETALVLFSICCGVWLWKQGMKGIFWVLENVDVIFKKEERK